MAIVVHCVTIKELGPWPCYKPNPTENLLDSRFPLEPLATAVDQREARHRLLADYQRHIFCGTTAELVGDRGDFHLLVRGES